MKYYLKITLYSFLPTIGLGLLTRQLWFSGAAKEGPALLSFFITIVVLPIYLLMINYELAKKYKSKDFIINGLIMVCCIGLSAHYNFIIWADTIGSRANPDGGTEAIISLEQALGIIIIIIGTIIGHFSIVSRNKIANADKKNDNEIN